MRPGIILNIARGGLHRRKGPLACSPAGHLAASTVSALLEPYDGPLKEMDIALTPHIGSYAKEARIIAKRHHQNLLDVLSSRS